MLFVFGVLFCLHSLIHVIKCCIKSPLFSPSGEGASIITGFKQTGTNIWWLPTRTLRVPIFFFNLGIDKVEATVVFPYLC